MPLNNLDEPVNYLANLEEAIVNTLNNYSAMKQCTSVIVSAFARSLQNQDPSSMQYPHLTVRCPRFGEDKDVVTQYSTQDVECIIEIAVINSSDLVARAQMQTIVATLNLVIGREVTGNLFGLSENTDYVGHVSNLKCGAGGEEDVLSDQNGSSFMVIGKYTFQTEYTLDISQTE